RPGHEPSAWGARWGRRFRHSLPTTRGDHIAGRRIDASSTLLLFRGRARVISVDHGEWLSANRWRDDSAWSWRVGWGHLLRIELLELDARRLRIGSQDEDGQQQ